MTPGMYLEKLSYSLLMWKASSHVWHMTKTVTWEQDSAAQGPAPGPNPRDQRNLLQRGQHEHRPLAHAGLGLAQDVHTQDALGDALVLDCGWEGGPVRGAWWPCRQRARVGAGAGSLPSDGCSKPQGSSSGCGHALLQPLRAEAGPLSSGSTTPPKLVPVLATTPQLQTPIAACPQIPAQKYLLPVSSYAAPTAQSLNKTLRSHRLRALPPPPHACNG